MSDAEKMKSAAAFVWVFQGFKFARLAEFGEFTGPLVRTEEYLVPTGLDPDVVAERIVKALLGDETDVPSSAFT